MSSKNITWHCKKSPVEDEDIEIIGTRPATSRTFSPIEKYIECAQTQWLGDRETGRILQYSSVSSSTNEYFGQHDTSYYQPQPPAEYTNVYSIVITEQQLELLKELIMMKKKWIKMVLFRVE